MMRTKYEIVYEKSYRRQYKLLIKRRYSMELLDDVVLMLANGKTLPPKYQDHPLKGNKLGYRGCHITGDWILIYKIEKDILTLFLSETGTHGDLFE